MQIYFYLVAITQASPCPDPNAKSAAVLPESYRKKRATWLFPKSLRWTLRAVSGSGKGAQGSRKNDSPHSEFCCFIKNQLAYS